MLTLHFVFFFYNNYIICKKRTSFGEVFIIKILLHSRAYRPQRGRGHVSPIVSCIPSSEIQTRQWFVTNYSNISCLDSIVHTEVFTIFNPRRMRRRVTVLGLCVSVSVSSVSGELVRKREWQSWTADDARTFERSVFSKIHTVKNTIKNHMTLHLGLKNEVCGS